MYYLKIDNLFFSYNSARCILCNLSLSIEKGGIFILLGRNGSGKTTLLKILIKYLPFYKGRISILGKGIENYSLSDLSREVAFLESEIPFIPLTVSEILSWGMYPYKEHFDAEGISQKLNLKPLLNTNFNSLSTGEKKRVLLGRIFVQRSRIVLIDEPFNFLDPYYKLEVARMLKSLAKERALLITTHDLNVARFIGDEVFLLNDGKIYSRKNASSLFSDEDVMSIFGIDSEFEADFKKFYSIR
jgi:iron complex transport system ATP-binding protein